MAGRKRKAAKREPNGRVQRSHEAANLAPFAERMRRYGLTEKDARDQRSSTVIGRLLIEHLRSGCNPNVGITEAEYEAGAKLARYSMAYAKVLESPRGMGIAETASGSGDEESYASHVAHIKERYRGAVEAVERLQELDGYRGKTIFDAMRFIVEQDLDLPHLFPGLKLALGVLAVYYGTAAAERKVA